MSLDLDTTAADATPVQGELLDAESSPLTLTFRISLVSSATNCSTPSTARTRRSIPANRRRIANSSSPASSASCSKLRPKSSMPPQSC